MAAHTTPQRLGISRSTEIEGLEKALAIKGRLPENEAAAVVDVEAGCLALSTNGYFQREYGGTGQPSIFCEVIAAPDSLAKEHCILQVLADRSRAEFMAIDGIELCHLDQSGPEGRRYQAHIETVSPSDEPFVLVRLARTDLTVVVETISDTAQTKRLAIRLLDSMGEALKTWDGIEINDRTDTLYFDTERELRKYLVLLEGGRTDRDSKAQTKAEVLRLIRYWAAEKGRNLGPQALELATKLSAPAATHEGLFIRINALLERMYDSPAIAQIYPQLDAAARKVQQMIDKTLVGSVVTSEDELEEARKAVVAEPDRLELRRKFLFVLSHSPLDREYAAYLERQLRTEIPEDDLEEAYAQRRDRENERKHGLSWAGFDGFPERIRLEYRHGFAEHVICPPDLIEFIPPMFTRSPIRHVTVRRGAKPLGSLPLEFTKLSSLALDGCGITDEFLHTELCGREWPNLRWLSISFNPISMDGVDQLAEATFNGRFPRLLYVDLQGCQCNPVERLSFDHNVLTYHALPDAGEKLEDKFGNLPWLHRTHDGRLVEMNRYALADMPVAIAHSQQIHNR